jgi:hypothetical protein
MLAKLSLGPALAELDLHQGVIGRRHEQGANRAGNDHIPRGLANREETRGGTGANVDRLIDLI